VDLVAVPNDMAGSGLLEELAVGVRMERVASSWSPRRARMDVESAETAYEEIGDDLWKALDERFGFDFADRSAATTRIASGPTEEAALVYGIPVEESDETIEDGRRRYVHQDRYDASLRYGRGVEYDTPGPKEQSYGLFGAREVTGPHDAPVRTIDLSERAMEKRREATRELEDPGFLLMVTYES
jgi:hypothetical protein